MQRISSKASSVTSESGFSLPSVPSVTEAYGESVSASDLYLYPLRLLVLEYINEPRFQRKYVKQRVNEEPLSNLRNDNHNRRVSWFSSGTAMLAKGPDEVDVLQKTLPKLEKHLSKIAVNKVKIRDEKLRRSLLKFYNDLFLNPGMTRTIQSMQRFEELIVYFTKASNGELNKLVVENIQKELYREVSYFIDLLIELAPVDIPSELTAKLQQYKNSVRPQVASLKKYNSHLSGDLPSSGDLLDVTIKPTFRISEVTHATYFMDLFQLSDVQLQQDIIKVMKEAVNSIYCTELLTLKQSIIKGKGMFTVQDFSSERDYKLWENFEIGEIASLLDRFKYNENAPKEDNEAFLVIPSNPRQIFVSLISKILRKECSESSNTLKLSQAAMFFLTKAAKYWRVDFPSTLASLVYTSANLSILNDEEINQQLTDNLFSFLHNKILRSEDAVNTANWNDIDQRQWIVNLSHTSNQCANSIDNLLSALYASSKPKFTPVLTVYYSYIDSDPAMLLYKQHTKGVNHKWSKRIHRAVFKTSEQYYISLLGEVPKDSSIEIQHIQNVAESIIEQIKRVQKRYTKPLLDKVNLPFECATVLIEAFGSDASTMIKRVEKYNLSKRGEPIAPVDALEAYSVFRELRDIYKQVQPDKIFPFDLEKLFIKYLSQLCDEVSSKVLKVIETSIKNETWIRVNPQVTFSSSVVDIFKMINESISMFRNLEWENRYQIAKIVTFLLKSFSDGLHIYANTVLRIIEEDLMTDTSELIINEEEYKSEGQITSEKMRNNWIFHEMKNALRTSPTVVIPTPYQFKSRTCILLNDLESMIQKLNDLDGQIKAEELSETIQKFESQDLKKKKIDKTREQKLHQMYTMRVIGAENLKGFSSDGLSNPAVSLVDTSIHREIAKTKVVRRSTNPTWDEEFEIEIPMNKARSIAITVWHRPSGKLRSFGNHDVCGKCAILLDPKKFTDDGFPNDVNLELDTQGKLYLQVSLESEKIDALFCIGRAYRTMSRALDRAIELIINKFSAFVGYAFSRTTLRTVCGANGITQASNEVLYDAIVPLFDYLNSNLNILASTLSQDLLFKVMLKAWLSILNAADALLLPSLSVAKSKRISGTKSLWGNAMSAALGNTPSIMGYGRALTQREMETIFVWLNALCVDFFHNEGEGPPLSDLKNSQYQRILLIPAFYDKSSIELKRDVERLSPEYTKYLKHMSFGSQNRRTLSKRSITLARKGTVMANASKKSMKKIQEDIKNEQNDPLERSAETLDIVLRTLLAKGEIDFVHKHLSARAKIRKSIATERLVKAAIKGKKLR